MTEEVEFWPRRTLSAAETESRSAKHFEIILFQITHIIKTYKPQDLMRRAQQRKEQPVSKMSLRVRLHEL